MTKKVLLLAMLSLMTIATVNAQDQEEAKKEGAWTTTSTPALKIGEFMFNNWSSSGNSQIDVTGTFFGNYKFTHPKYVWDNIVDLAYGYAWQDLAEGDTLFETRRKSNDKIDLTSAISWKAYKDWGASFTANLKTQFGAGYEYSGIGANQMQKQVSGFFAPAYLTTALSFEHKKDNWSVSLSFLTGKTTFVCNDELIDSNYTYGVIQEDDFRLADGTLNPARTYKHVYFALGSYVKAMYLKKDILPNLDLYARLELFYDYKKPKNMSWGDDMETTSKYSLVEEETWDDLKGYGWMKKRAFETDLDFELKLDYRFSSFLSANFALNTKWDTDFNGMGKWGHWQIYQMAGIQVFFNWKTPKS
ncbi:MAG: DUF3078 domain-containing protein [Bacteroidales bacterium]|nr:DUF3078 domain-containing protein [Bacteroidales bacterium]